MNINPTLPIAFSLSSELQVFIINASRNNDENIVNSQKEIKYEIMKTALQIDISFDQILSVVKQLPRQQKIKLTKELEKEAINSRLSRLLKTFKTKDLDLKTINEEVEIVRQEIYDKQKRESNF